MIPADHPGDDDARRVAEATWNALFAADMKRLVRAARENDHEKSDEIRRRYSKE
ncbi:hypothetical protein ACFO4E_21355 [Nocardiopsis mangrovi]|uniref:Uncharacterized protein n=1 Tax=Nocardiopsis mangrovi TaxID=1179818 RepID=A0ABV9E010_9ACTN